MLLLTKKNPNSNKSDTDKKRVMHLTHQFEFHHAHSVAYIDFIVNIEAKGGGELYRSNNCLSATDRYHAVITPMFD